MSWSSDFLDGLYGEWTEAYDLYSEDGEPDFNELTQEQMAKVRDAWRRVINEAVDSFSDSIPDALSS